MTRGQVTTLGNGLRVATRAMPHASSLSVGIWVNAGARDERDDELVSPICWNIWPSKAPARGPREISRPRWKMLVVT